jgi:murein DD-endopeptidase MepM/ murein hydrolase activator NlpD
VLVAATAAVLVVAAPAAAFGTALGDRPVAPAVAVSGSSHATPAAGTALRPQVAPAARYAPPVDAPVVDGFRPPASPYAAGNRGWEYETPVGTTVAAAGDGTVTFAGQVGPAFAVTIRHADDLRTSYSQLGVVLVQAGDQVRRGDPVGRATDRLHFGVRRGDVYLDPATLFAPVRGRARLVPLRRARSGARRTPAGPLAAATLARRPPCRRSPARPRAVRQYTRSRP